jgi:hypothetical protein
MAGRGVETSLVRAGAEQLRCSGSETALGEEAYRASPANIREALGTERLRRISLVLSR